MERLASMAKLAQHPQAKPVIRNPAGISADVLFDGLPLDTLGLPTDEEYSSGVTLVHFSTTF